MELRTSQQCDLREVTEEGGVVPLHNLCKGKQHRRPPQESLEACLVSPSCRRVKVARSIGRMEEENRLGGEGSGIRGPEGRGVAHGAMSRR